MTPLIPIAASLAKTAGIALAKKAAEKTFDKLAEHGVQRAVNHAVALMADSSRGTDLISYSQPARLEPILLLDQRATYVPFIRDVIHTMSNLFTAYFLQSIALDTTISGVKVLKRLDKFNPDRDLSVATRSMLSTESYENGLPFPGEAVGLEAYGPSFESSQNKPNRPGSNTPLKDHEYDEYLTRAVQNAEIKEHVNDYSTVRDMRFNNQRADALNKQRIQDEIDTPERREARAMLDAEIRAKIEERFNSPEIRAKRMREEAEIRRQLEEENNSYDRKLNRAEVDAKVKDEMDRRWNTPQARFDRAKEDAIIKSEVDKIIKARGVKTYRDGSKSSDKYSVDFKDMSKLVNDITNLAVGKMIEVTISENDQSAKIPVLVRMRVTGMSPAVMVETLSVGGHDGSFRTRLRQWRAGEISFWKDAVFAMDRIEAHRKAAMRDTSGYYGAVHKRDAKNRAAATMSGNVSVGTASSIVVITEQTRKELERQLNRRISDFRTRQDIFEKTFTMLLVVVDPEWETVTIYHRGIEMPTELTAKDITTSAKGSGPDIGEVLKMFMEGRAPGRL